MSMKRIYMDHAATTPLDQEVLKVMLPWLTKKFGNPSSIHSFGREAKEAIEEAREKISRLIGAHSREIIFTSGASEANNWVLKSLLKKGDHLITSSFEHHSILHTAQFLEKKGVKVTYLPVSKEGFVSPQDVQEAITKKTKLVSILYVNNEIGTIQNIQEIGKICHDLKIHFHTDAVQAFGKLRIDVKKMHIDFLSASAHKIYGPKGIGCLFKKEDIELEPFIHGGSQEFGLRAGTENVAGIIGFGKACELAEKRMEKEKERLQKLRDRLIKGVLEIPDSWLNGSRKNRIYNNGNFGFEYVEGESLVMHLDLKGVAASTGSACSSESFEPSHVLLAIGLSRIQAQGSLRLTLGKDNTREDIEYVIEILPKIVENLRKISPLRIKEG